MKSAIPSKEMKGQQPAVSPSLEAAARHDGKKAPEQGLKANAETAPVREDPAANNAEATAILHKNARTDAARKDAARK